MILLSLVVSLMILILLLSSCHAAPKKDTKVWLIDSKKQELFSNYETKPIKCVDIKSEEFVCVSNEDFMNLCDR